MATHAPEPDARAAIWFPESSRSLSAIIPVSPSSGASFGKKQLGTDFGKADASDASRRDRQCRLPTMGSQTGRLDGGVSPLSAPLGQLEHGDYTFFGLARREPFHYPRVS